MLPWACERSLPHREGTSDYRALGDRLKPTPAQVAHGDGRQEAAVGGPQQLPALAGHSQVCICAHWGAWAVALGTARRPQPSASPLQFYRRGPENPGGSYRHCRPWNQWLGLNSS